MTTPDHDPSGFRVSNPTMESLVDELSSWAENHDTAMERAAACRWALELLQQATMAIAEVRMAAIRDLYAQGWSLGVLAQTFGVSRTRIHQIVSK